MDFRRGELPEGELATLVSDLYRRYQQPILWLVPKSAEPFSMKTFYPPFGPLFSDKFRSDFKSAYQLTRSSDYFDVYSARVP